MKINSININTLNTISRILKNKNKALHELRTFDIVQICSSYYMFFFRKDIIKNKYVDNDFLDINHMEKYMCDIIVGYNENNEFYYYYTLAFKDDLSHHIFKENNISKLYLANEDTYNYFNNKKHMYLHNLTHSYLEDTIRYHNYNEFEL